MDVSIIIVNFNTKDLTVQCINSIFDKTLGIKFEIIVVDNNSKDGSIEILSRDNRIVFIESHANIGFGKANNLGFQKAIGKYVFFLNSDTMLVNNAIKELFDFAERYTHKLGALGCVLEDRKGEIIHSYGDFPTMKASIYKLTIVPFFRMLGIYKKKDIAYPDQYMRVDYITGADLFVPRNVLEKCGAFDPDFFMYYEETEMEKRFQQAGYDRILLKGPRIIHFEGESSNIRETSLFIKHTRRQLISELIYYKKTRLKIEYYIYRILLILLRQFLWLYPHISFKDKITYFKTLFTLK